MGCVLTKGIPPLLLDRVARYVFSDPPILKDLLKSLFEYLNYDIDVSQIKTVESEKLLPSKKYAGKDEYMDLLCQICNIMYTN